MNSSSLVVVTGATGHVGNVLVRTLVGRGERVRSVVPEGENVAPLAGLDVEVVRASVEDRAGLARAFDGAGTVYHLAGIVTISSGLKRQLEQVNVRGTANVCAACRDSGVGRLVYTSSVHALPEPEHGTPVCETGELSQDAVLGEYARSKVRATIEVQHAVAGGLDAVVVFPSGVVGPYDFRPSEMGQLVLDYCAGRIPARVNGAYDFVDVRDLTLGLLSAAACGRRGEGYLLSGNRVTVDELFGLLFRLTGIRPPGVRVPMWLAHVGAAFAPLAARLSGRRPLFTTYSLKVLASNCLMNRTKAERELGFRVRPAAETLADTVAWFRSTGRLVLAAQRHNTETPRVGYGPEPYSSGRRLTQPRSSRPDVSE